MNPAMNSLSLLPKPSLESLEVRIDSRDVIRLTGTIAVSNPRALLGDFLEAIHRAAVSEGRKSIRVNVSELSFVNSSAIRLFMDWAMWIGRLPPSQRYRVHFQTNKRALWQRSSFGVLQRLSQNAFVTEED